MAGKTVIFDMDGVLFDSEQLDKQCWKKIAGSMGLNDIGEIFYAAIGRQRSEILRLFKDKYGEDFDAEGFIAGTLRLFDEYVEKNGMPVKPLAKAALTRLKESGVTLGLASSTLIGRVRPQLHDTGLDIFFDDIVGGGMFSKGKPDPEIFLLSFSHLNGDSRKTYVIEDSYNGIRAAYAAGFKPVMVPDLLESDEEIRKLCYAVCRDLSEACDVILGARSETDSEYP